jgi:hypothetical protein
MNPLFQSSENNHFYMNACVGENTGGIEAYSYMQGFSDAFFALSYIAHTECYIHPISHDEKYASINGLIYPMLYCARHHLELFIKYQYTIIAHIRNQEPKIPQGHDLAELFKLLQDESNFDRRMADLTNKMKPFISAFAEIDSTGQTFRYATNTEGKMHLAEINTINATALTENFSKLASLIEEANVLTPEIEREYSIGTNTKKLSRDDICVIAVKLPHIDQWHEPSFKELKEKIKSIYKIGGKELSDAINIIKKHREFSPLIGIENKIEILSEDLLDRLKSSSDENTELLSDSEWRILFAICEVGRSFYYSESFDSILDNDFGNYLNTSDAYRDITSRNYRFYAGLIKTGQASFIKLLKQHYPELINDTNIRVTTKKWKILV